MTVLPRAVAGRSDIAGLRFTVGSAIRWSSIDASRGVGQWRRLGWKHTRGLALDLGFPRSGGGAERLSA